jgi:hypothetical protein
MRAPKAILVVPGISINQEKGLFYAETRIFGMLGKLGLCVPFGGFPNEIVLVLRLYKELN